jgi:anaerobic selenocysteine-containing dehydrogenase
MHVIVTEKLYDAAFVGSHTTGFEELAAHILLFSPRWGARRRVEASQIISFARA